MSTELADEQLQKRVQEELHRTADLDVSDFGVTVERGVVGLDGHVPSVAQRRTAVAAVHRVPGVRAIVDNLDARPYGAPARDEARIAREALDAIDLRADVPADRIQVVVHDGRVRLEGTVDDPAQREAAETAAGEAVFSWGAVEDKIIVAPRATAKACKEPAGGPPSTDDDLNTLGINPRLAVANGEQVSNRESNSAEGCTCRGM